MKKFVQRLALAILMCVIGTSVSKAIGWPANYQGVMLQGFYWDSYNDSKWTKLESQADELSKYFSLIWVPNSGKASGNPNMGYMPIYWFTNHNSSFGTEAELRSMIKTFKAKGTGIIADVVINHRVGVNNWADFPTETWNGKTYSMGASDVCRTDEWGQGTGNNDTGDDFGAARDLDHTSANVQNCCKDYCKFLLTDLGYTGFRYDMVKGYSGQYTKMYNTASNATFSVGEYWDGSYDAVKAWIDATGKTSAAFDFPFKYAVNDAFSSNDMTKLVWKANGTTPQPAGMIHFGYTQYAVTFIDNHDTYRDNNKFNGNVVAANAFMLMSPGTPCVFLPHYTANKQAIQRLIDVRNSVGLHNNSAVNVLKSTNNCYMAEVTGTKGKLVVKVGSAMDAPSGYTSSDIVATGNDYCVWTKVAIQGGGHVDPDPDPVTTPDNLYVIGNIPGAHWNTNGSVAMTKDKHLMVAKVTLECVNASETHAFFSLVTKQGASWDDVNGSDRYGAESKDLMISEDTPAKMVKFPVNVSASSANSWKVAPGTYYIAADFKNNTVTVSKNPISGVEVIETEYQDVAPVYYNLQGVRVENPTNGLYIVVRGNKVSKVLIH